MQQAGELAMTKTTKLRAWMHVGAQKGLKSQVCGRCELLPRSSSVHIYTPLWRGYGRGGCN